MKTIGIIAPNHGRPKILELWCASINRLRRDTGLDIPAVVVSGAEDEAVCKKHSIIHITLRNFPVSEKFNTAVYALRGGVDYCTVLGSDDIVSTETFKRIHEECQKGYDLIGVEDIYFFATDGNFKGKLIRLHRPGKLLGVGKTISSKVLDQVNWRPWTVEKNWGLDGIAQKAISPYVKTSKVVENAVIVDLKDAKYSLNKASFWFNKINDLRDPEEFYSILGEEEKQLIKNILL